MIRVLVFGLLALTVGAVGVLTWFSFADPAELALWMREREEVRPHVKPPCLRDTWHVVGNLEQNVVRVGPWSVNSSCEEEHPVLCRLAPGEEKNANARPDVAFREPWVGGVVRLSPPLKGDVIKDRSAADSECARRLGDAWSVARVGDARDGFAAIGPLPSEAVFWVLAD